MPFTRAEIQKALTGISGILIAPLDEADRLVPERQRQVIERAIAAGIHILVANGNTGEFYALTMEEAEACLVSVANLTAGRAPVVAGIGRGLRDACRLAAHAAANGADALMIHQPPDPFVAPRGIETYVQAIAAAAPGMPLVLYLRNDAIGTANIARLTEIDAVIGVKWATPNPMRLAEAMAAGRPDIVWVGGLAETWAPTLYAVGARGFTSGLINVWPERSMAIHAALEAGDFTRARTLIREMSAFEEIRAEEMNGTNVTGVKAALAALGHDCGAARAPAAWPLNPAQSAKLAAFLQTNAIRRYDQ